MRLAVFTLACSTVSSFVLGAALELDPVNPPDIELIYDTYLTGNNDFCAASPHDLYMTIDCSSGCSGQFILEGSAGATAPVSLELTHNWDDLQANLIPGQETPELPSQGNNCGNHRNQRAIKATVNANDINPSNIPYERNISISIRNRRGDVENGSFYIRIGSPDMIRISGLQDLALTPQNNWQQANEQVCVFSTTGQYSLTATSTNNGLLTSNGNNIPYSLDIKEPGTSNWQSLTLGQPHPDITASDTELCANGVTMGIRATALEGDISNVPTGNYGDTVTLTVEAT